MITIIREDKNLKIYSSIDIQKIQSSNNPSSDVIFDMKDDDKFILKFINIKDINNKSIKIDYMIKRDWDEDLSITKKLMNLYNNGIEVNPIVIDENFKIMDGLHRFYAQYNLGYKKIKVFQRIIEID